MLKRGQGLPLNTIIIAVIVLIVLVVIIFIFSGRLGLFQKGIDACSDGSNPQTNPPCPTGVKVPKGKDSQDRTLYCCVNLNPTTDQTG